MGKVENWQRESPKYTGKVVDMSNYQRKVQESKHQRVRPKYMPNVLLISNKEEEEMIKFKKEQQESEYWDKKYALETPLEDEESAEEDDVVIMNAVQSIPIKDETEE